MFDHPLVALAAIILLGTAAQWLAWRARLPAILGLLAVGFLVGPGIRMAWPGQAGLDPDHLFGDTFLPIVSLSVALILYEGGMSLKLAELAHVGPAVRNLVTLGALVTWGLSAAAAYWLFPIDFGLALLVGAILTVTGPTVIGPLLRHVRPTGPGGATLKWEGIVIDPIGALLAVLVFEFMHPPAHGNAGVDALMSVAKTVVIGGGLGAVFALALAVALRRHWIPDFLENAASLALAVTAFAASNLLQDESGLLAVTIMGIVLANQKIADVRHIVEFKENLRVLLLSSLFVLLAARVRVSHLESLGWANLIFVAALILVVRPASVLVSTFRTKLRDADRTLVAGIAPRGIVAAAVASVFALRLEAQGHPSAHLLVPIIFSVIVGTVAFYGLMAAPLARRLKLAEPDPQGLLIVGAHSWARGIAAALAKRGVRTVLVDSNPLNALAARDSGLNMVHGSIISEHLVDQLDLGGIGRMLAITPNFGVNSMAVEHMRHVLGRPNVYQLAPARAASDASSLQRDSYAFGPELTYAALQQAYDNGHRIGELVLPPETEFGPWREKHGANLIPLLRISPSRRVHVFTAREKPSAKPGDVILGLMSPELIKAKPPNVTLPEAAHAAV